MVKKEKYVYHFITGVCERVISLNITSVEVQGGVQRLQTMWTPELVRDLEVYHNIDAETELTNLLSQHVAAEIDREILENLNENTQPENGFDIAYFPVIRQIHPRLIAQDIVPLQPLELPIGRLQYFTTNLEQEFESYLSDITWRSDETWSYENFYGSKIGIKMELKPHGFIKKYRSVFDTNDTIEVTYDGVPEPGNRYENLNPLIN